MANLSQPPEDPLERDTDVDERFYQPRLLWGYFLAWIRQTELEERWINVESADPRLLIFRRSETGAYLMSDPTLYWKADISASHFTDCDQDSLWENGDDLGEVQGYIYQNDPMTNPVQWNSFAEFLQEIYGISKR